MTALKVHLFHVLSIAALLLIGPPDVQARPVALNFSVHAFSPAFPAPPDSSIAGRIIYDAADTLSPIDSLLDVTLQIDGHAWQLADIEFENDFSQSVIGGTLRGARTVDGAEGRPDFFVFWNRQLGVPLGFAYATDECCTAWSTSAFSAFDVRAVPEPPTLLLSILAVTLMTVGSTRTLIVSGRSARCLSWLPLRRIEDSYT